jgi:methyl-accepting chemotaxis protein
MALALRVKGLACADLGLAEMKAKLGLLLVLFAAALAGVIWVGTSFFRQKTATEMATKMVTYRQDQEQRLTEVALGIVRTWHNEETAGHVTRVQAQAGALAALRPLHYAGAGYFFIQSYDGVIVLYPIRPDLEGQRLDATYLDKRYFEEQINTAKAGGGFVYYHHGRVASSVPAGVAYVAGFAPWQWAIGTATPLDDIETELQPAARADGAAGRSDPAGHDPLRLPAQP